MPSDATEAALGLLGLTTAFTNPPLPPSSFSPSTIPTKRKQPATSSAHDDKPTNTDSIDCICGFTYDDGFSIACDKCARWCHAACFQIVENEIPDVWLCSRCDPRPVDKERAIKIQKARQRAATASANANKRRASPGVERKPRRPSGVAAEVGHGHTNKRKRRVSITAAAHAQQQAEDEHVDIDEPWQQSYVHITKDIVKSDDARDRLRRVASDWRGVTAISPSPTPLTPGCSTPALLTPDAIPSHPPITLQPLTNNPSFPSLFAHGNSSVRPPSYAVHATQPIQSSKLIAPYPSTIMSTAAYLADPLNAYAHLGMPKPFVHLIGPPLDVALDARFTGDQSRFVRSGCRPNAVIRPVVCHSKKTTAAAEDSLSFGIFALRDLKPNEEVVLGWEWDDGNVVHHLPALIDSPFAFPPHEVHHYRNRMTSLLHALSSTFTTCACGAKARDCALARMAEFVENQTPLTPSPSPPSQFAKEKNANATKGKKADHGADNAPSATPVDLGPLIGIERGFRTRERIPFSGGMGGVEMIPPQTSEIEAGPSREYAEPPGARQRKVSFPHDLLSPQGKGRPVKGKDRKGKGRADEDDMTTEESDAGDAGKAKGRSRIRRRSSSSPQPDAMEVDGDAPTPTPEEKLPPKLRKTWIRETAERLREHRRHILEGEDVKMDQADSSFDSRDMPPPPVPPSRTPPLSTTSTNHAQFPPQTLSASTSNDSTSSSSSLKHPRQLPDGFASPSTPFAKLSLDSPVASAPSAQTSQPHLPTHLRPQSPSDLQTEVSSSLPSSQPQPRKRKVTTSLSQPSESKEAKKPRVRTRKEKPKEHVKDKIKHTGRDRDGAGARTPSTPTTPSTPAKELDALPALVRKESTTARRKKTASQSPRIVVKEVTPKESPRSAASALPSPAAVPAALPPPSPKPAVEALEKPSTGTPTESAASTAAIEAVSSPSPAASTLPQAPPSEAPPTSPSPNPEDQQKETAVDIKERTSTPVSAPAEHAPGSEPTPAAAPEAAAKDVEMVDARPGSPPIARQCSPSPAPPASSSFPPPQAPREPLPSAESLFDPDPLPQPASPPRPATSETDASSAQPQEHPEQRPAEPDRPLTPPVPAPPPPPPKVKLSLKDFAQRKRKQREEEKEREKAEKERALASPCVDPPGLPAEPAPAAAEGGEHEGARAGECASGVAGAEPTPAPAPDVAAKQETVKKSESAEDNAPVAVNVPSSEGSIVRLSTPTGT
ncbi:hypothetical protein BD413DRAFT_288171 [Trametes elegans]|nr:hypothetical protein BD413DRAFT_288171 [Trametes elegans]